jgi:hypothetical protein
MSMGLVDLSGLLQKRPVLAIENAFKWTACDNVEPQIQQATNCRRDFLRIFLQQSDAHAFNTQPSTEYHT